MYSIEQATIEWLESNGFAAYAQVPKDRPTRFCTVERTGGGTADMVDHPLVAIQTWADTQAQAEEDAVDIRNLALTAHLPVGVHSMRVNSGPYRFYDEQSMQPRYQTLFDVACQIVE